MPPCPGCNTALPPDAAYCLRCGAAITDDDTNAVIDPLLSALKQATGTQYEIRHP